MGIRILILKLGAMGDALRTTPILTAFKRKFPLSHITWVTDHESFSILNNNPLVDRLLVNSPDSTFPLLAQSFDILICLDKDPSVTALAMKVDAVQRLGFAMSPYGTLDVFNDASSYALHLGLDDDLKFFRNDKTYQRVMYEMAELPFHRDPYIFCLTEADESLAKSIIASLKIPGKGPLIGLNTGCGTVFPTKKWPDHHFIKLVAILRERLDARVFLLGGKSESETNRKIETAVRGEAISTGHHSLGVFAGILKKMDAIVAGDPEKFLTTLRKNSQTDDPGLNSHLTTKLDRNSCTLKSRFSKL